MAKRHEIIERTTPISVMLTCTCGWSFTTTRKQNAWARAAKLRGARAAHWAEVSTVVQRRVAGRDSFDLVPADEYESKYYRVGVEAFIAGKPYTISNSDSEWRRGWTAALIAAEKLEGA